MIVDLYNAGFALFQNPKLYESFLISTSLKLPSQFYYKFLKQKIHTLFLSALNIHSDDSILPMTCFLEKLSQLSAEQNILFEKLFCKKQSFLM